MKKLFILVILIFVTLPLYAQLPSDNAGTSANLFLRSGLSARGAGFGEAFTGVSDDENALFYNPAGLANISKGAFGLNHTQWFSDIRMDNLIFGYNFDRKLGIGFSVAHMWMPAIEGKDGFGNATGDVNVSSTIINLGLGYKVHRSIYAGIGLKYFQDNLAQYSANGVAFDFGIYMYTMVPGMTFGFALQNIGGAIQYDMEQEKIPFTYRAGLGYKLYGTGLRLAVDGIKTVDSDFALGVGAEYTFMKTFAIRLGNQFRSDQEFSPKFGAGLNFDDQYMIDYSFFAFDELGSTHKVGFTFRFNLPEKRITKPLYRNYGIKKSRAPASLYHEIKDDKMVIHWGKIYGAVYNVYAKSKPDDPWKKINKRLINDNFLEFKKPSTGSTIYVSVTSVMNSVESPFSKEVKIDVK